ncbi:hypothetical protein [Glaciihabitans sp. UYNi722]|uniref:hypothetical protein n=1 Tax=Glaciihabitans sp. UYNi722 TaxID=3156344 RepID=UPI0033911893
MRAWRIGLVIVGVLLLALGAVVLVDTVKPIKIIGVASWFLLALIVHDGIIAFVTFGVGFLLRRAGRKLPVAVLATIQGALVVCAIFAIIVLPAVYKQFLGSNNPTILPLKYGPNLIILWASVVVLTTVAIVGYYAFTRRQKNRLSVSQD